MPSTNHSQLLTTFVKFWIKISRQEKEENYLIMRGWNSLKKWRVKEALNIAVESIQTISFRKILLPEYQSNNMKMSSFIDNMLSQIHYFTKLQSIFLAFGYGRFLQKAPLKTCKNKWRTKLELCSILLCIYGSNIQSLPTCDFHFELITAFCSFIYVCKPIPNHATPKWERLVSISTSPGFRKLKEIIYS